MGTGQLPSQGSLPGFVISQAGNEKGSNHVKPQHRGMPSTCMARLLELVWVAWHEGEEFQSLESGRPEFECRCHHLLLVL